MKRTLPKKNNAAYSEKLFGVNLEKRLDVIISLLLNPENSKVTDVKKIEYLTKMSFSNDEIARLLGTTKKSVEAQKYKKPKAKKDD